MKRSRSSLSDCVFCFPQKIPETSPHPVQRTFLEVEFLDTNCSALQSSRSLVDTRDAELIEECSLGGDGESVATNVIIGNTCDYIASSIENLASHWNWTTMFTGVR